MIYILHHKKCGDNINCGACECQISVLHCFQTPKFLFYYHMIKFILWKILQCLVNTFDDEIIILPIVKDNNLFFDMISIKINIYSLSFLPLCYIMVNGAEIFKWLTLFQNVVSYLSFLDNCARSG